MIKITQSIKSAMLDMALPVAMRKGAIIAMALTITRHLVAVLDFKTDLEDFIFEAGEIVTAMGNAPYFGASAATLTTTTTDITSLVQAHAGTKLKPPTHTVADRDVELRKVQRDLRTLRLEVQTVADASPGNAENIITSANMKVKKLGAINKQDLSAKDGPVSGTVILVAKAIENSHAAHDWAMSLDGTNWIPITPTLAATTTVTGLTPGTILDLRHRAILKDGPTNWIEVNDWVVR